MSAKKDEHSAIKPEHRSKSESGLSDTLGSPTLTPEEEVRAWRKIDLRLIPILALIYFFAFLDKGNIGLATLQGLNKQLGLTGDQYNIALTMFFLPFCLFEIPSNLLLKKFRPSRWLPGLAVLWGIVMMSMGFVKTYPQLVGARVCLGFAEAGLSPGILYYLTLWYPRHKLQYRIGLFFGAASVAGTFSGLLAYAISFMSGTDGRLGWSWIFILEGCATIAAGILAFFVMVDFPSDANFLTPAEKSYVMWRKKYDTTPVGEEEHFELRHIMMAVTDWQLWLHISLMWAIIVPMYGIGLFLPSIIHGFGYSSAISSLLTVPPYAVATVVLLAVAHYSDKQKLRWPFVFVNLLICAVGFGINITGAPAVIKYLGTFLCVIGAYSAVPGIVAWLSGNIAGQYKRAVVLAIYISAGNCSGMIASNVYKTKDAPRYIYGHASELGVVSMGLVALPIMVFLYKRANARREDLMREATESGGLQYSDEELRKMGDKAPNFRYGI